MNCKHADYHSLRYYACCATRFIAKLGNNLDILAPGFSDFYITIYILTASFTNFMFIGKLP